MQVSLYRDYRDARWLPVAPVVTIEVPVTTSRVVVYVRFRARIGARSAVHKSLALSATGAALPRR